MSQEETAAERRPGAAALFLAFLQIAMSGFGGVLPFARRILVERRAWVSEEVFNETLALCQALPGPNIVNLSIVVGARFAGPAGSIAAFSGLVLAPLAIVIGLGAIYDRFGAAPSFAAGIGGLGAAAAGLVAATAIKMAVPLVRRSPLRVLPVMAAGFVGVGLLGWPLPWVMLGLAPVSIALARGAEG